ncbi:MAG: tetratricopeptide repeat protein [Planctomycetes bacterium]|nr:tetratricopeptide repeat protein [Planctomycetota bacterium]
MPAPRHRQPSARAARRRFPALLFALLCSAAAAGTAGCRYSSRFVEGFGDFAAAATVDQLATSADKTVGPDSATEITGTEPHWVAGKRAFQNGEFARAIEHLKLFYKRDPESSQAREAWAMIAASYRRLGDDSAAAGWYAKVLDDRNSFRPDKAAALMALGDIAFQDQSWSDAAEHHRRALAGFSDLVDRETCYYRIGVSYRALGEGVQAREYFNLLVANFPDSPHAAEVRRSAHWQYDYFIVEFARTPTLTAAARNVDRLFARGIEARIVRYRDFTGPWYYSAQAGRFRRQQSAQSAADDWHDMLEEETDWDVRVIP